MKTITRVAATTVALTAIVALSAVRADAKQLRVPVTNIASGTDNDQNAAIAAAKSAAEAGLICTGTLEGVRSNSSGCVQAGDAYVCTAVASGTCVIG